MLDALTAADGESPNARRIDRAVAQARADAKRNLATPSAVWKDPFAENPDRAIPVRGSARSNVTKAGELAVARRQLARARAETAVAQAEAATAQADAARAKANAAKAEASAAFAQAMAAKHEAVAARAACVDPRLAARRPSVTRLEPRPSRPRDSLVNASVMPPPARLARRAALRMEPPPPPSPSHPVAADPLTIPLADEAFANGNGRAGSGILVVPITR